MVLPVYVLGFCPCFMEDQRPGSPTRYLEQGPRIRVLHDPRHSGLTAEYNVGPSAATHATQQPAHLQRIEVPVPVHQIMHNTKDKEVNDGKPGV
jgi:hypothetical protein